jgi:hypothetical protein
LNNVKVVEKKTAIFDTGLSQIIGDPDGIAKLFSGIKGAKLAPQYGAGTYISALQ